jgi:DNA-binding transcriptional LysR family regulator
MTEIDLNLLRVFDALFELRSVTRAASRLGLTQSAVSHALRRLRNAMDDPLFVRAPGGLQPTARAAEIAPGVREGLVQLRGALSPTVFDPATASRRFTIAAGSYFCVLLVPALMAAAREAAPGIELRILPMGPELLSELDESVVDLALGAFTRIPARLRSEPLFREEMVWIAAAANPLAKGPLDRDRFAAAPRLTISVGRPFEALKTAIPEGVLERKFIAETGPAATSSGEAAAVYDALTAIATVGRTDLIAMVPKRFAKRDGRQHDIVKLDAPDEAGSIELMMLWHSKFDEDAGLAWLRGLIRAQVASL